MAPPSPSDRRLAWAITAAGFALLVGAFVGSGFLPRADLLWIAIAVLGGLAIPQAHLQSKRRKRS